MTQLSAFPVSRRARSLTVVKVASAGRVDRYTLRERFPIPRPAWSGWSVHDAAVSLLSAAVALVALQAAGLGPVPWLAVALMAVWPVLLASQGLFVRRPLGEALTARAARVLRAGAGLAVLSWAGTLALGDVLAPAVMVLPTMALTLSALAVTLGSRGRNDARVVLAGHAEDVQRVAEELVTSGGPQVVAACVPEGSPSTVDGCPDFPVRSGIDSAVAVASRAHADTIVFIPGPDVTPAQVRRLQWQASALGVGTYVTTGLLDVASYRMSLATGPGPNLVHVRPARAGGPLRVLKEVSERSVAALALVALLPVLGATAALVRLDSPGRVLFRQTRVGRHGRPFTMLKFRTMATTAERDLAALVEDNESPGAVLFKLRADPRVTRLGRVLRRYSLDELPQLWNVLVGDMALVGPRPALPEEVAKYDHDPHRRLAVKPGITGLWQVSGRSDLNWEQTVRLDLRYVDNWSLRLDASILCRTVRAVLDHRGAY